MLECIKTSSNTERNKAVDVIKLVCTIVIIAHHSGYISGFLNRGYIAVEFFFIVSGVFLYQAFENNPELSTVSYFVKRAKRLYPEYWFSLIVLLFAQAMIGEIAYKHWYSPIFEVTLVRCVGIPLKMESLNGPCWYLSVLMFGGLVIYFLLRKLSRRTFNMLAIMVIMMTYGCFVKRCASIEQWDTIGYVFYQPFWRGVADMLIGTIIYQVPKPRRIIRNSLEICSGIGILALLRLSGNYDYLALAFIIIMIWSICSEKPLLGWFGNDRLVDWFGRYQYGMYVNHICAITVFKQAKCFQNTNPWVRLLVLLICVLMLAMVGRYVTCIIERVKPHAI